MSDTIDRDAATTADLTTDGPTTAPATPLLNWHAGRLRRGGVPHQMLSGSLHYFRVHPDQWTDRLLRLTDLGLNTVDTYVPWNFHQPRADRAPDFTGWRDLEHFVRLAGDAGLDVVVRPGPYICAEWSNGGLPAWLTGRGVPLRTASPGFLDPVEEWFAELLPRITGLQAARGGPVVAVQVENEFGSYGDDAVYLDRLVALLRAGGVTELLYTADGPTPVMLDGGSVPGVLTAATLGSKPAAARDLLRSRRPDEPFVAAEYWSGWFDHWGHAHHVRGAVDAADTLRGIVADGGSVSIYMAHGGTNFGLWSGANDVDGELRPTTTSYDSDAPVAEDGTLTDKFFAMRAVLAPEAGPVRSAPPTFLPTGRHAVRHGASLAAVLDAVAGPPVLAVRPAPTVEDLGLEHGLVRYGADVLLPEGTVQLGLERVADRALVSLDGEPVGTVTGSGSLPLVGRGRTHRLEVLVEVLGRVNYGGRTGELKGLTGRVVVERRAVQTWDAAPVDVAALDAARLVSLPEAPVAPVATAGSGSDAARASGPGVATAIVTVEEPADAHLALPGFTKGFVWVNGFLLGRYWNVGPQQTLYLPAPLLRRGANDVVVLELHERGAAVEVRDRPELGPTEVYVEEF